MEEVPSVSGSTCHPSSESWQEHLRFLLAAKKGSDAAMFLRKWLREAARKEGVVPAHMRFKTGNGNCCTGEPRAATRAKGIRNRRGFSDFCENISGHAPVYS